MRYQLNKKKFLDDKELASLTKNLDKLLALKPDRFLPILVALKTGCRRSELLILKLENIDFEDKTLWIKATKGSDDRVLPMESYVMDLLRQYTHRACLESGDLLFPMSVATVFRIWNEVRPVPKCFHSLRHTFAINVFKKHRDIRLVQVALGHRNIQNTLIYSQYVYSGEELKRLLLPVENVV